MAVYTISGYVLDAVGTALAGVAVATSVGSSNTSASGYYSIAGHANGTYQAVATKTGYTFTPSSKPVTVAGADQTGQNIIGRVTTYGSDDGVSSLNKERLYTTTGTVTTTDLGRFRGTIEAEMDARFLQAGYEIPVTGTRSLAILGQISDFGVAAMAEDAQFMGSVAPDQTTHASVLWKLYHEWLDRYTGKNGQTPAYALPDAVLQLRRNAAEHPHISLPYAEQDDGTAQIFAQDIEIATPLYP